MFEKRFTSYCAGKFRVMVFSGFAAALLLFTASTCRADEHDISTSINFTTGEVILSGSIPTKESGKMVSIQVLYPETSFDDLNAPGTETMDVFAFNHQTRTGANGTYSFRMRLDRNIGGYYTAYIGAQGQTQRTEYPFLFVSKDQNEEALGYLFYAAVDADDSDEVIDVIRLHRDQLGFTIPLYDVVNQKAVADNLCSRLKKGDLTVYDGQAIINVFEQFVIIQGLNQSKVTDLAPYMEVLGLDSGKISVWYSSSIFTPAMKQSVLSRITGKGISGMEGLKNAFDEAVVLEVIKNPSGFGNVKRIIEEFSSEIGISTSGVKDSVYQKLSGNTYGNYLELQEAFKALLTDSQATVKPPGGGTGAKLGMGSVVIDNSITESPGVIAPISPFRDIENVPWAKDAILALYAKGIITGKTADEFCPDDNITREEFVKLIVKAFGYEEKSYEMPFEDVGQGDWYYVYVATAYVNGVCKGVGDNLFGAGSMITRQDMAVMLYNAFNLAGIELHSYVAEIAFEDEDNIAEYAKQAVRELQKSGIINGVGENRFDPLSNATRAQAAKILHLIKQ